MGLEVGRGWVGDPGNHLPEPSQNLELSLLLLAGLDPMDPIYIFHFASYIRIQNAQASFTVAQ